MILVGVCVLCLLRNCGAASVYWFVLLNINFDHVVVGLLSETLETAFKELTGKRKANMAASSSLEKF